MIDEFRYEDRLLYALESIAESLNILAAKPPVNIQITSPVGVEIATEEGGQ